MNPWPIQYAISGVRAAVLCGERHDAQLPTQTALANVCAQDVLSQSQDIRATLRCSIISCVAHPPPLPGGKEGKQGRETKVLRFVVEMAQEQLLVICLPGLWKTPQKSKQYKRGTNSGQETV